MGGEGAVPTVLISRDMSQTRREFLVTSAAALTVAAATTIEVPSLAASPPAREPDWIIGDPFTASADHPGLGGGSFEEMREAAMRFRCSAEERERYVLGWEI